VVVMRSGAGFRCLVKGDSNRRLIGMDYGGVEERTGWSLSHIWWWLNSVRWEEKRDETLLALQAKSTNERRPSMSEVSKQQSVPAQAKAKAEFPPHLLLSPTAERRQWTRDGGGIFWGGILSVRLAGVFS
jgi:hypothetical protein